MLLFCISAIHMCVFISFPNNENTFFILYRLEHYLFVDVHSTGETTQCFFFIPHGHVVPNKSSLSGCVLFLNQWNNQSADSIHFACTIRPGLGLEMFQRFISFPRPFWNVDDNVRFYIHLSPLQNTSILFCNHLISYSKLHLSVNLKYRSEFSFDIWITGE